MSISMKNRLSLIFWAKECAIMKGEHASHLFPH
jgi:hypothetical protein